MGLSLSLSAVRGGVRVFFFFDGQSKEEKLDLCCCFIKRTAKRGKGKGKERLAFPFLFSLLSSLFLSTMASREEQEAAAERAFAAIGMAPSTVQ